MTLASAGAPFSYTTHTPVSSYSFSSGPQAFAAAAPVYSGYAAPAQFGYAAAPVAYAAAPTYYQAPAVVKSKF